MKSYENDGEKYLLPLEICTVNNFGRFFLLVTGVAWTIPLILLIKFGDPKSDIDGIIFTSIIALLGIIFIALPLICGKSYLIIDTEKIQIKNNLKERNYYWSDMNNMQLNIHDTHKTVGLFWMYFTTNYFLHYSLKSGKLAKVRFSLHRKRIDKQMLENTIWYLYNRYHQNIG